MNGPRRYKFEGTKFLVVDEAHKAIFGLRPGFKERPFIALGSQQMGP